jgi:Zn-dependent protease with chaperone function
MLKTSRFSESFSNANQNSKAMPWTFLVAIICLFIIPEVLTTRRYFDRHPRLGVSTWVLLLLCGSGGLILSLIQIGVCSPGESLQHGVAVWWHHVTQGNPFKDLGFSGVFAVSVIFDLGVLVTSGYIVANFKVRNARIRQRELIDLLATRAKPDSVCVIEHQTPTAYFVPGDGGRVVVSTGTIRSLGERELEAVVAHERGHQEGHHGAMLILLQALAPFFNFVPAARYAPGEVLAYLEMTADDVAVRATSKWAILGALEKARYFAPVPAGSFGLSSLVVDRRIDRLRIGRLDASDSVIAVLVLAVILNSLVSLIHSFL